MELKEAFVTAQAPHAKAAQNGRALARDNKLLERHISQDRSVLFGVCRGSGKSNYACSCDFQLANRPVYRCSCPSRQFPCKHCLGLMYAYVEGRDFEVAPIPADIQTRRERARARAARADASADPTADASTEPTPATVPKATKPRKVNKSALKKKIAAQLKGLDLLEQLTLELVRTGIGHMNARLAGQIEQQAKQLGNSYLPGAQTALHEYTKLFTTREGRFDAEVSAGERESIYSEALDYLTRLHAMVRQGRTYLTARLEDPELRPDTETPIAAWLGHAWQLSELKAAGCAQQQVELVQLAFRAYDDVARREYVETGIWMNLANGSIQLTQNYRPYHAAKFLKAEDSCFDVIQVPELCIYPGNLNPRIRWNESTSRPPHDGDYRAIRRAAHVDFIHLIKQIKEHLKMPLADKRPVVALAFQRLVRMGDELAIEDATGQRIALTDQGASDEPPSCHLLELLPASLHQHQALIGRFYHDLDEQTLKVKPLSLVTESQIYRFTL